MNYFEQHAADSKRKIRKLDILYVIGMAVLCVLGAIVLQYSLPHMLARAKAEYDRAYAEAIAEMQPVTADSSTK